MRIIITADIVPTKGNYDAFERADVEYLIGSRCKEVLDSANILIMNLETPITDIQTPLFPWRPSTFTPERTFKGLKAINSCFYSIANNHILDQKEQGLLRTIELLDKAGIAHAGAGRNKEEAAKPFIFECENMKIGVYCCAEHEFSIVTDDHAGANPYDPLVSYDDVYKLKNQTDYVIVLYHGGREHYRYPSPELQKRLRKFAERGADLIIAQHTHCIGCYEVYNEATIVYGQGNFLYADNHNEYWDEGLMIQVEINDSETSIAYLPIVKQGDQLRLANINEEGKSVMESFMHRSKEILTEGFVKDSFRDYVKNEGYQYAKGIKGERNLWKRIWSKWKHKTFDYFYEGRQMLGVLNLIEDETHREIVIDELKRVITGV